MNRWTKCIFACDVDLSVQNLCYFEWYQITGTSGPMGGPVVFRVTPTNQRETLIFLRWSTGPRWSKVFVLPDIFWSVRVNVYTRCRSWLSTPYIFSEYLRWTRWTVGPLTECLTFHVKTLRQNNNQWYQVWSTFSVLVPTDRHSRSRHNRLNLEVST